ncbi:MAG: polymerase delta subunit [Planctomycetota bacterium]|nr:polymerase delta subunit [Planctomycetota bacterium]
MLAMEFLRTAGTAATKRIFAVVGDDAYLRREAITAIVRTWLGADGDEFAVSRFPGESAGLSDVLDELRTLPFLAKARVVIVENADPFVTAHRRALEAFTERPSSAGVLVLSVKSWPATTKLAKQVEKVGLAIDCKTPSEKELPRWLVSLAKTRSGAVLEQDASELLVELVGAEIGLLAMEVEKLSTYVGERKRITREDVATMVDAGRVQKIWSVINAATTGRGENAIVALDALIAANESPHEMLGALRSTLLKTYHAGMLRTAGMDARQACVEAGIYPGGIDTTLKQHTHLGPSRVSRLPEILLRADMDLKGASQLPPQTVMERLFVELSRPRRD